MHVIKRSGEKELVHFDKITERLQVLCDKIEPVLVNVEAALVAKKVIGGLFSGVTTSELDNLAAETCAYLSTIHPEYGILASRIAVSNMHKQTSDVFSDVMHVIYVNKTPKTDLAAPLISKETYDIIQKHKDVLNKAIDYNLDYGYDYFGWKTLERSYLTKFNKKFIDRPQQVHMRVAIGVVGDDIEQILKTYRLLSNGYYIHGSPTIFQAGTIKPQMSSCFLLTMREDSIDGIYDTLKQCALISKSAGGIGLAISNIRATNSYIAGTNGFSNGIVPMLKVYDDTAAYVDQGGGKRKGAFAIYLEPWHADVEAFLDLKKAGGKEERRARNLNYALWVPDLFMKRVEIGGNWSLFCPSEAPGMMDVYGKVFEDLYTTYEATPGLARKTMKAQDLWNQIMDSQIETGNPYMLYKDMANEKSNYKHIDTIRSSNLCTEIMEVSNLEELAVCNLCSVALPKYVVKNEKRFDHKLLYDVVFTATRNLNHVIDRNYYPVPEARTSNMRHRPIGIGVQGLADVFIMMRMPFESQEAAQLNREIFETIYFAALSSSLALAKIEGPHKSFEGSPASKGILQFDMWTENDPVFSGRYDWDALKREIIQHGLRNITLIAPMPTASTSQILGNTETTEPITSNMYTRRTLAGDFPVINKHLIRDLVDVGLWNVDMKDQIVAANGSIQNIANISGEFKALYKTVWEISSRALIDLSADRGPFIDQSQSFSAFMAVPTRAKLTNMHFYCWRKGLKTGMYYLRTRPAAEPAKVTVSVATLDAAMAAKQASAANAKAAKSLVVEKTLADSMINMSSDGTVLPIDVIKAPLIDFVADGDMCPKEGCGNCGS